MTTPHPTARTARRVLTGAALITLAGLAGGCGEDATSQAVYDADVKFREVAAGPEAPTQHAEQVYGAVEAMLRDRAGKGPAGAAEAAAIMLSAAQQGLAATATREAAGHEFEVRSRARVVLAHAAEWSRLNALAEAAATYDPAPELADLDEALRETRAELTSLEERQVAARARLGELDGQIEDLLSRSEAARTRAGELQLEMANASSARAVELAPQIRDLILAADRLELDARRVETTREQYLPTANEIDLNIERVQKQRELLTRTRTETNTRGRAAEEDEQRLRAAARQAADELREKVSELEEYRKTTAESAFDDAISTARNAASSARTANDKAREAGSIATALANQSQGLLGLRRAQMHLTVARTYESIALLGLTSPYEQRAEEARGDAESAHGEAVQALDNAVGAMRRVRLRGDVGDRLDATASMLERFAQTPLGDMPDLAPAPAEPDAAFNADAESFDEPSADEGPSTPDDGEG